MKVFVGFIVLLSCIMVVAGSGAYSFASIQELPPVDPVRDKLGRVLPVLKEPESGDCQGTVYKKRGECKNTSGDILDGSEGKCGKGKVSWALDVKDPGYKAEFGPLGKCPNFEELRDCEVPCPKPCEGDTWKKGQCVRKDANGKVTVLDGTKGKCGDGILDLTLDTTAADYKPAVGSGRCVMKKEGACFVKCPKPEPPKCSYVTAGWQKNDLGCVTSKTPAADGSYTRVSCGQSGWRQEYKASTLNTEKCDTLTRWVPCKAPPCPIDCVGSWSDWSACTLPAGEVCGITKTKSTYRVTREKNSTGKACPNGWYDGQEKEKTCGQSQSVSCCTKGNWENVGEPLSTGKQKQKRTVVGCDPNTTPKVREIDACYMSDWVDQGCVGTDGKKKQKRTVKGARCGYGTKSERNIDDLGKCCKQSLNWTAVGKCGEYKRGKQKYTQDVAGACASGTDTKYEDCPEDCKGYYTNPPCPTGCGIPPSTLTKTWVTTATPLNGGKACPGNTTKSCDGTMGSSDCRPSCDYTNTSAYFIRDGRYSAKPVAMCNEHGCNRGHNRNWWGDSAWEGRTQDRNWRVGGTKNRDAKADICAKHCNEHAGCKGFHVDWRTCYLYSDIGVSEPQYCSHKKVKGYWRKNDELTGYDEGNCVHSGEGCVYEGCYTAENWTFTEC